MQQYWVILWLGDTHDPDVHVSVQADTSLEAFHQVMKEQGITSAYMFVVYPDRR